MVPGKVVDSRTIVCPARTTLPTARAALRSGPSSGSRFAVSGVGTQMMIASASCSSTNRVLKWQRSSTAVSRSSATSSMCDRPPRRPATFWASTSTPITSMPASANSIASGSPT